MSYTHIGDIAEFARKKGSKDKVKRKPYTTMNRNQIINTAVGHSAYPVIIGTARKDAGTVAGGLYVGHRAISQHGKERKASKFARTGAVVGALGSVKTGVLKAQELGYSSLAGAAGAAAVGAGFGALGGLQYYGIRRAFAKDKKKFDSGY